MKKIILLITTSFLTIGSYAQIGVYKPYRANGSTMVGDSALFIGKLKIPSFASVNSLGGFLDKAGQSFALNLSNGRISVRSATSTWLEYPTLTETNLCYIQNQTGVTQTGNYIISGIARSARIGLGGAPLAQVVFQNSQPITGATSSFAYYNNSTIQSDVTGTAYGLRTLLSTQAAAFSMAEIQHYVASQGTIGAGSSVTSQFGFNAQSSLIGASVNYGFYGNIPSSSGRWNLYMNGTAQNYLAGNLGLGVTVPLAYIHIKGGTSSANTAPIKLTTGTVLATPENGAMEYDGTNLFFTPSATTRKTITYLEDLRIVNTTTTALTNANLNSTYGGAPVGYRVICHLITGAPTIYTKATENGTSDVWLTGAQTTTP